MRDSFRDFLEDGGDLSDLAEVSESGLLDLTSARFKTDPVHVTPIVLHPESGEAVGTVAGAGVTVVERGNGVIHQSIFTLVSVIIPTATTADSEISVGGIKIYDFPAGAILRLGCQADLSSLVVAADQSKLADAASEGDFGLGTVLPANQDALGTDATDDDWGTAQAYLNSSHIDADIEIPSEAVGIHADGTLDLNLNGSIDAADITNTGSAVTVGIEMSGIITVTWIKLGLFA